MTTALIVTAVIAAFAIAGAAGALLWTAQHDPKVRITDVNTAPGYEDQTTWRTPAGPAVVTKVLTDQAGFSYEIETCFRRRKDIDGRGDMVRLHYIAPSRRAVKDTLQRLSDAHLAGEPQSGMKP